MMMLWWLWRGRGETPGGQKIYWRTIYIYYENFRHLSAKSKFFLIFIVFFKYFFSFYLRQYHKLKCNVMLCCWPIILLPYMMRNPSRIINPKAVMIPMPKKNPAAPYNWQPWSPYNQLNKMKIKSKIKKK